MKKRTILILSIALVLIISTGIIVNAVNNNNNKAALTSKEDSGGILNSKETVSEQTDTTRKGAPLTKTVTFLNSSETKLTYKETGFRTDSDYTDKYIDELNNEYYFNSKDIFIGYSNNDEQLSQKASTAFNKNNIVSETEAFDTGKQALESLIGEDFKNYTHKETILNDLGYYSINFEKHYGDIAIGESAIINVYATGDVFYCYAWNIGEFENFDVNTLADITSETLQNYVTEEYSNGTLKGVYLERKDNKIVLKLSVSLPEQEPAYLYYQI